MAKMTPARSKRWHTNVEKAAKLISDTLVDMGDAKVNSTGSVNAHVIGAANELVPVSEAFGRLLSDGSPITVVIQRLEEAAAARKAAQAARQQPASDEQVPE